MSETSVAGRAQRALANALTGKGVLRFWAPAQTPSPRKKPPNLIFGLEDSPPLLVTISNGVQHVGLIAINLVYPLLVCRAANAPVAFVADLLAMGMLVCGIGTEGCWNACARGRSRFSTCGQRMNSRWAICLVQ
jgi:hypothetical protein